jgi:hypothetical protein
VVTQAKKIAALLTACGVLPLVAACDQGSGCTASRAVSSVMVFLQRADYPELAGGTYQLCVADQCSNGKLTRQSLLSADVVLPDDVTTPKVTVRLRITAPGAHFPSLDQSTTTTLTATDTVCAGTYYSRTLALTPADGLNESVPTTGPWDPKYAARPRPASREGLSKAEAPKQPTEGAAVSPSP